jgi:hypothetical protein
MAKKSTQTKAPGVSFDMSRAHALAEVIVITNNDVKLPKSSAYSGQTFRVEATRPTHEYRIRMIATVPDLLEGDGMEDGKMSRASELVISSLMAYRAFCDLIKSWSFEDSNGTPIPCNAHNRKAIAAMAEDLAVTIGAEILKQSHEAPKSLDEDELGN